MVSVQTSSIEKKEKLSVYNLNYPIIKSDNEKNIIGHINKKIYEDIISFKCSIEDISNTKNNNLSCISTDYYITYNNNGHYQYTYRILTIRWIIQYKLYKFI